MGEPREYDKCEVRKIGANAQVHSRDSSSTRPVNTNREKHFSDHYRTVTVNRCPLEAASDQCGERRYAWPRCGVAPTDDDLQNLDLIRQYPSVREGTGGDIRKLPDAELQDWFRKVA